MYQELYGQRLTLASARVKAKASVTDYVMQRQIDAVLSLAATKRERPSVITTHSGSASILSISTMPSPANAADNALGFAPDEKRRCRTCLLGPEVNQPSIEADIECAQTQSDIHYSNNTMLEMAIADFCHCKNIPGRMIN